MKTIIALLLASTFAFASATSYAEETFDTRHRKNWARSVFPPPAHPLSPTTSSAPSRCSTLLPTATRRKLSRASQPPIRACAWRTGASPWPIPPAVGRARRRMRLSAREGGGRARRSRPAREDERETRVRRRHRGLLQGRRRRPTIRTRAGLRNGDGATASALPGRPEAAVFYALVAPRRRRRPRTRPTRTRKRRRRS